MPGVVADGGERQPVLRAGQPVAVLRAAAAGDRRVLHVHLAQGEPAQGAGRAGAQRRRHGAAVQDEGDHDDHVRGGAVRGLMAAAVRRVHADQVLRAAARRRAVHDRLAAGRAVAGRRQLVHQPAAVRHIQPAVPRGLPRAARRQRVPRPGLQHVRQVPEQPGGYGAEAAQTEPAAGRSGGREAGNAQDHRRDLRARATAAAAAAAAATAAVARRRPVQAQVGVGQGAPGRRRVCRLGGAVLREEIRQLVRVMTTTTVQQPLGDVATAVFGSRTRTAYTVYTRLTAVSTGSPARVHVL